MSAQQDGEEKRVCAIIINYFGSEKTASCLKSLRGQLIDLLILVDNSADNREHALLEQVIAEIEPSLGFPIAQQHNEENLGFGRAINAAIRNNIESTGGHKFYLLLNNDAAATPGLVSGLVQSISAYPKRLLVSPRIHWGDQTVRYHYYQPYLGHVTSRPFPGSFPYLSGCCLLVDNRALVEHRLFDEDFFMYGEDAELSYRLTRAGWKIHCADHLLALHEGSGSSGSGSAFYEYHTARSHLQMVRKQSGIPRKLLAISGRAGYLPARALLRTTRQSSFTPLAQLFGAFSTLPKKP